MKTTFKKLSSIIFVALLMFSVMPLVGAALPPSIPPPDNIAMYVTPVQNNMTAESVGYRFNVTLWGKTNVVSKGWSVWLKVNGLILNITGAWYCLPTGQGSVSGPSEFMQGVVIAPVVPQFRYLFDGVNTRVEFGEGWMMGATAPARPAGARMALIELEVLKVPNKGETLETLIDISTSARAPDGQPDSDKTYIIDGVNSAIHYYTAYDAVYGYKWSIPAGPELAVDPATRLFDRYTEWNGTTFTETVKLKSLSGLWYLTNVSFTLNFNTAELEITDIVGNTVDWNVALTADNTTTPGQVVTYAETNKALSGNITIITITFRILDQELYPTVEVHNLTFTGVSMYDHTLAITPSKITPGAITVEGFLAVAMPWMEVKPKLTTMGSDYGECVKHQTFQIEVTINRLHFAWRLIGVEFRLLYDDTLLKVVDVEEGPYLGGWALYETWFTSFIEPNYYGPHVLVGNLILPNASGKWNPPFPGAEEGKPGENGTIAIITFEIIYQTVKYPPEILDVGEFELFNIRMVDPTASMIPVDTDRVVNGTYQCWSGSQQGRFMDLYGGAENAGYGSIPFPAPYGGQGLNKPMDLVIPQSEVTLFADVTYNFWPVQSKDVGFEVEGPYDHIGGKYIKRQNWFILLKETARTNEDGVATISFAMPWYCEDPESLLGVWKVTATVNIRDVIVIDTMYFYYDYMVHIWKVTTDKFYYEHCESVAITVDYGSHAMQEYPGLFSAMIKDELNVVIGIELAEVTLGGAVFCVYANDTIRFSIHVEKWAFVGYADIYVNCFDKDPTEGGFAWTPQAFEDNIIYILPI